MTRDRLALPERGPHRAWVLPGTPGPGDRGGPVASAATRFPARRGEGGMAGDGATLARDLGASNPLPFIPSRGNRMGTEFTSTTEFRPHSSHWGVFSAALRDGELLVRPHPGDPDPNAIIDNFPAALRHPARVARPMVRRG